MTPDPRLPQHDDPYADGDRRPLPDERSPRILLWLAAGLALLAGVVAVVVTR